MSNHEMKIHIFVRMIERDDLARGAATTKRELAVRMIERDDLARGAATTKREFADRILMMVKDIEQIFLIRDAQEHFEASCSWEGKKTRSFHVFPVAFRSVSVSR